MMWSNITKREIALLLEATACMAMAAVEDRNGELAAEWGVIGKKLSLLEPIDVDVDPTEIDRGADEIA